MSCINCNNQDGNCLACDQCADLMTYTVGDQVRYARTGQLGIVKFVDDINHKYTIEIDGIPYSVSEDELC